MLARMVNDFFGQRVVPRRMGVCSICCMISLIIRLLIRSLFNKIFNWQIKYALKISKRYKYLLDKAKMLGSLSRMIKWQVKMYIMEKISHFQSMLFMSYNDEISIDDDDDDRIEENESQSDSKFWLIALSLGVFGMTSFRVAQAKRFTFGLIKLAWLFCDGTIGFLKRFVFSKLAFLLLPMWWAMGRVFRYVESNFILRPMTGSIRAGGASSSHQSTLTMALIVLSCKRFKQTLVESTAKVCVLGLGIFVEVYMGSSRDELDRWTLDKNNRQHVTMYATFIMGTLIEMIIYYGRRLDKRQDYLICVGAFTFEAVLFKFFLETHETIEVYFHALFLITSMLCILISSFEANELRKNIYRYYSNLFTFLQGIWLFQVGFSVDSATDNLVYSLLGIFR